MSEAVSATGILVKRRPLGGSGADGESVITTSSVADPSVITTTQPHGLLTGQTAEIADHTGSTPDINGSHVVTVLSPTTFSIPVNVTVAGAGGTVTAPLTTIGEITNVTPPGFSRNKLESSTHNEGTESNVLGMLRQRDPAFRINYVGGNATHQQIVDDILNNRKAIWQVAFPSGVTATASARVQQFNFADAPPDAIQSADVVLTWAETVDFDYTGAGA